LELERGIGGNPGYPAHTASKPSASANRYRFRFRHRNIPRRD
jgi:hypothetical protein